MLLSSDLEVTTFLPIMCDFSSFQTNLSVNHLFWGSDVWGDLSSWNPNPGQSGLFKVVPTLFEAYSAEPG